MRKDFNYLPCLSVKKLQIYFGVPDKNVCGLIFGLLYTFQLGQGLTWKKWSCPFYISWYQLVWLLGCSLKIFFLSFNLLRLSDAIWRHRSGSTLAQVMACCLMAPSHYLNQCWLIISKIQLLMAISQEIHQSSMTKINMKITHLKCY